MGVRLRLDPIVLAVCLGSGALVPGADAAAQTTRPGEILLPATPPAPPEPVASAPDLATPPAAQSAPATPVATLTVQRFEIAGNTLFETAELQTLIAGYLGRPVTLLEIYAAADRIAAHYAEHGYTLASVNVPPQAVTDGRVRLLVSEGRLARLSAEGTRSYRLEQLARYLPGVGHGSIYRSGALEDGLRTLNTLPGLSARAVIKPGEVYGTSDVLLRVSEDRVNGLLSVDNFGRDSIGAFRYSGLAQINNPLHAEDQLQLLALRSENGLLNYGYGAYSLPVAASGGRLTLAYGHADFTIRGAPVDGRSRSGRVTLDQPLLRSAQDNLGASLGVSRTLSNADFGGATFNETAITLAEFGLHYSHTYRTFAVTQIGTTIATNFDRATRADLTQIGGVIRADQRLRWELDLQHLQPVYRAFQVQVHVNGVYSPDPLADTQQYALGGPSTVRGYAPAEIRGDRGYFAGVDLRRPFALGDLQLSGRVFADSGRVYLVDAPAGVSARESLSSVGVGLDARYARMALKLDWAFPRDNHVASDGRDSQRLYGSLAVTF